MIKLDETTKTIEVDLDAAVTTNQLQVYSSYSDVNQTNFGATAAGSQNATTNDTTAVTIVSAPSATTTRKVDLITVYNADTLSADVTIQLNNNSTLVTLVKQTLESGETLQYADGEGWSVANKKKVPVVITDSQNLDAFSRLRTSGTGQRLDVEFLYDKQPNFFDEVTNNGTVTFNSASRDLTLSISNATNGTYALMSSHPVPYTPGNSQLIEITSVLDLAGIGSGIAQAFLRSSVSGSTTEEVIDQSSWLTETSGVDWTDSHIFAVDFQSLKVGRIRYLLNVGGIPKTVAEITNDNVRNTGFWQLASLPLYYRLYNDATYTYMEVGCGDTSNAVGFRYRITANASATMKAICCTVKSEGGQSLRDMPGIPRCASNGTTIVTVSTTIVPILSIRVASTFNSLTNLGIALPKSFSIVPSNPIMLIGYFGATLTGASWTSVTDSIVEYDVSATAISGGSEVLCDYFSTTGINRSTSDQGFLGKTVLWSRLSSETGIFTLAAQRTGSVDSNTLASINWEEIR